MIIGASLVSHIKRQKNIDTKNIAGADCTNEAPSFVPLMLG